MKQWFSKSIKLSVATDSGVPVNKSLIVSRVKCSGILVNNETTSKETMHSFGRTVTFFIVSKNRTRLSIECGELAVRGLRKPCSQFARLWQDGTIRETIIWRGQPSLCTFDRASANCTRVDLCGMWQGHLSLFFLSIMRKFSPSYFRWPLMLSMLGPGHGWGAFRNDEAKLYLTTTMKRAAPATAALTARPRTRHD